MLLCVNKIKVDSVKQVVPLLVLLLFILLTPQAFGQEEDLFGTTADDSLLFGSEFDLGGDDFSFDFDDAGEADSSAGEGDDFFGDFEDDAEETVEDATAVEDDWGFEDDSDSTAIDITEEEYPDHPLNFRKNFQGTMFDGAGLTVSFYSPQYVAEKLDTWYSYMDFSLSIELPYHFETASTNISFLVDISSFNFTNSFPAGGSFNGVSLIPVVRAEAFGLEAEAGVGMYSPTFGIMAGLGYAYQYQSLFFSAGYRWNWAYKIDPIGSGWWLEPRITTGIKLW